MDDQVLDVEGRPGTAGIARNLCPKQPLSERGLQALASLQIERK